MARIDAALAASGMVCRVYRRLGGTDRFGQSSNEYNAVPVAEYPCRVSYGGINANNYRSGEVMTERYVDVVAETREIFVSADADVSEQDALDVVNEADAVIVPFSDIQSVRPRYARGRISHKEIISVAFRDSAFQGAAV